MGTYILRQEVVLTGADRVHLMEPGTESADGDTIPPHHWGIGAGEVILQGRRPTLVRALEKILAELREYALAEHANGLHPKPERDCPACKTDDRDARAALDGAAVLAAAKAFIVAVNEVDEMEDWEDLDDSDRGEIQGAVRAVVVAYAAHTPA